MRTDPLAFFRLLALVSIAIIVALTIHEFSHALAANQLGDDTPKRQGRLSFNPLVHLDPFGTLFLFLVGFGWGKPVPVNVSRLRGGRRGMAQVALAGPLSGLVAAAIFAAVARFTGWWRLDVFVLLILFCILLSLFNLIPLPPLDGYQVVSGFLPAKLAYRFQRLERYGAIPLIMLLVLDNFLGLGLLWRLLQPAVNLFSQLYLGWSLL